jgi:uncharacterized membrane-anchored protein YhcB (DUF1043 family)
VNTWKVILATLVIFGAGVITGGLLVTYTDNVQRHQRRQMLAEFQRVAQKPNTNSAAREIRVPLPANILLRKDFLERLDKELKLTVEQRERIEKIIGEGQERIKAVTQKFEPQVREELALTREKIRAELKSDQQDLFTELLKRRPVPPRDRPITNPPAFATPGQPSK